jgi:uncharacterized glyoxalase superfamily protein PhnB
MIEKQGVQQFSPVLVYDDAEKAIQFLTEAFGFTEHVVHRTPDGAIAHAELAYRGGYVGLSDRTGSPVVALGEEQLRVHPAARGLLPPRGRGTEER